VLVAEMEMSHEKMRTFINGREPHQVVRVRQRNEGKVQCVADAGWKHASCWNVGQARSSSPYDVIVLHNDK
jgi:hypothetical protein